MSSSPGPGLSLTTTSTLLLDGLRDPSNHGMWQRYVDRYRPPLVGYARRLGVPSEEAEDVAQQILLTFCEAYRDGKYDRERGRLRTWLFTIAYREIMNWHRAGRGRLATPGEASDAQAIANLPADSDAEVIWEQEWRDTMLRVCLEQVRSEVNPTTYEAFRRFVLDEQSAHAVAEELKITQNAVFLAKRRVLQRVKALLPSIDETY